MQATALLIIWMVTLSQVDPLTHMGSFGEELRNPGRMAVAADGTVLVADPSQFQIVRFDAAGAFLGTWSVPECPIGIAVHPDSRYFVSYRDEPGVGVYDAAFTRTGLLGESDPLVSFVRPTDIAVDPTTGRIYVVDSGSDRFFGFDADGSLALIVGVRGKRTSEFKYPSAIAVDSVNNRIVVADQDNYRIQVFNPNGAFVTSFGYRIKYLPGGLSEGWMPRSAGLAVDGSGNIYLTDAMMGTLRIFNATGAELGKVIDFGYALGQLRTPGDVALTGAGEVVVANSSAGTVEFFAAPAGTTLRGNPGTFYRGTNLASNLSRSAIQSGGVGIGAVGQWSPTPSLSPAALAVTGWDPPHQLADTDCNRCHAIDGQPGGHLGLEEGQAYLCMSCHTGAGHASVSPFFDAVVADPYGTNADAEDGRGTSHAWGVPAVNVQADSIGPAPGSQMGQFLDGGKIKCSTCHNQHNSDTDAPFLRVPNDADQMCKECHAPRNVGLGAGGSHPVGFLYPGGVGEFPDAQSNGLPPLKGGNVECMTCHGVHVADSGGANGAAGDGMLLRGANDGALCRTCHTDHVIHGVSGSWSPTCRDCHDLHDPANTNLSLVARTVRNQTLGVDKAVVFVAEVGTNSFSDGDAVNDGICQVCHTATAYHQNGGGGVPHNEGKNCTECHPHETGFMPTGGDCTACHSRPQDNGDGIPVGGRRAVVSDGVNPNDFSNTSHHYDGDIESSDCLACHDMSQHRQGSVRLKDPDDAAIIYNRDVATADDLDNFCLNCHDADGASAGTGTVPFGDGRTVPNVKGIPGSLWDSSAHKNAGQHCSDCHGTNAHGSPNIKLLQAPAVDTLCYQCHRDGMLSNPALTGSVDDIQEAFSQAERHNLGTTFTVDGRSYAIQCSSCHNPHVVTGKHWDVANGVSPVTRPDLNADPTTNPRAMGTALWGAVAGEKMRDFAAQGPGTGGWYYSIARGNSVIWDQGGFYQPPKTGSGYSFEFGGEVLPDYTTLCLDCHTHRMSAANPPVNWGQGVACTDNSVDPPNQRVECGAQHGLAAAGTPSYMSDSGTAGNWGASGNPDVLFDMNYVTRGRGAGHFMRWPYDSAERNAGINFVMSCTDCHEAHGSAAASMLRTTINAYGPGTSNWNTMCNNCHYYYGGQHAGMSCGNASCHEANSIHRIIHVTGSGAGSQLRITAAGYEDQYVRPDFTPEIAKVEGIVGEWELTVTFTDGVWTDSDLTAALQPGDFWLFDTGNDNPRTIDSVAHIPGAPSAILTMSKPLGADDIYRDTLSTTGKAAWNWYGGGYVNWATGEILAQAVSAGPWPVPITGGPSITAAELTGRDGILVTFDQGVYSQVGGELQPSDFVLDCAGSTITSAQHAPGNTSVTLVLGSLMEGVDIATCVGSGSLSVVPLRVVSLSGNPANTEPLPITMGNWPCSVGATSFQLEESAATPFAFDIQNQLIGTVGNPAFSFLGDGTFSGEEGQDTYIDFDNNLACLKESDTITIEARVRPTEVDRGIGDNTFNRIFERRRSIFVTILNTDYRGDDVPERMGKASIEVKYRTDNSVRHDCPHSHWPEDTYVGSDVRTHQISSDIERWPIVNNHWYQIKVVFNSGKGPTYGTPVDIYIDDQGTNGLNSVNPTPLDPANTPDFEQWPGYVNATMTINESSSCKWGAIPGDFIEYRDESTHIGASWNHNQPFAGQIDWVNWAPVADYAGVDDLPNFGDPPAGVAATPGNGAITLTWNDTTGADSYNIYWATTPGVTRMSADSVAGATSPTTVTGLTKGVTYYFIVTAVYSEGEAGPSREVSVTPSWVSRLNK